MSVTLTLLHDADGLVAVDKPPGLESTGRTTDDPAGVQRHLRDQLRRPVWLVHQLDRDTSGVLLFVRKKRLVAEWQAALKGATKRYLAIVHGELPEGTRTVDAPLAYDRDARRWVVREGGKPARTTFEARGIHGGKSLLEARLHSGRTHQIRVHLAHLGHPLLGEQRYREPPCEDAPRQALHAWRLELPDRAIEAPLPTDLRALARRYGLPTPPEV